ncbi:glycerophosphoryl diester phosphodiesterase [Litchfieldella qijiaojingensis]|uniref:glycerophosphodiester phosphodiesterase n=1 Tax=Litchfieldella qijiaojingensis TaxID=980347 RepID=A0ABQ2YA29_9GAMM|nr:glycerophosphodiester phosphodiesterase family protein [Halomonas qijiaojingensis]GGX77057.1 glycerophosphoryl diester phosphodiesterase [Halomonas qijiaojingensis]
MNTKKTIATLPTFCLLAMLALSPTAWAAQEQDDAVISAADTVTLGPRPLFLVQDMDDDSQRERELKADLLRCATSKHAWRKTDFSIGHRGAAMQFPEHTRESYIAGAQMGAGILECDVTFTADQELVCRHSQCDLHATTNILETDLAQKCRVPPEFDPNSGELVNAADIQCCTSDITLAEFQTLEGKMEGANSEARSIEDYLNGTPGWRTDLYASRGTLMTHAESIALFKALGVKMTPELKAPSVEMPFDGMSQEDYAQKMIDEYKAADVSPRYVYPQSFNLDDVRYWLDNEPEFGEQAVFLDGRYDVEGFDHTNPDTWSPSMEELVEQGVQIIAPPMWMLLAANPEASDTGNRIVPSVYAERAKDAGLDIITWTFERSGPLNHDGEWYHQTTDNAIDNDGDKLLTLDVLARDVGINGLFSDWPATVTFYDNCMKPRA